MTTLHLHPDYRALLEAAGLATFDALFEAARRGPVDGHGSRAVSRLEVGAADGSKVAIYVKRHWGRAAVTPWRDLLRGRWPVLPVRYEWDGALQLRDAGIEVARPVAWGRSEGLDGPRALIAFREVEGPSLAAWLSGVPRGPQRGRAAKVRRAIAEAVGRVARRLHDVGFSFPDLYAKHLYLVDADTKAPRVVLIDVQRLRMFMPHRRARDLAALYVSTQVPGVTRTDRLRVLRAYLNGRSTTPGARRLIRRIQRAAVAMPGRGRDPGLLDARRTAPPGLVPLAEERMVEVDSGRLRINQAMRPMLEAAGLTTLDAIMALDAGEPARDKRRQEGRFTVRLELEDPAGGRRAIYVKRYTRVPWRTKLRRTFSLNPPVSFARNEARSIVRLADLGIPTMRRVAVGEALTRGGRGEQSCILTEEIPGATQADRYFEATFAGHLAPEQAAAKHRLIRAIASLARRMHGARLSHRDFYLCHLMVRPVEGADPVLHLIDLQRLTHHRRGIPERWVVKDLAALRFSWWPSPATHIRSNVLTDADWDVFALEYFQTGALTAGHKRLLRKVGAKARRIARREAHRRGRKEAGP